MAVAKVAKVEKVPASTLEPITEHKYNLDITMVPLENLKLWDNNPRVNDEAADKLIPIIGKHGFISPIIATPDGIIRAGNTRYKAAIKMGFKTVPVIYVPFGSESDAEMYSVADNRASEFASWDQNKLSEIFGEQSIKLEQMAVSTGFSFQEIEGLRNQALPKAPEGVMVIAPEDLTPEEHELIGKAAKSKMLKVLVLCFDNNEKDKVFHLLGVPPKTKITVMARDCKNVAGVRVPVKVAVETPKRSRVKKEE